jgi:DNA-binding FadR family transcriptional regulator
MRPMALRTIHNKRLYQQVADQIATRNRDGARLAMHHHLDQVKAVFPQNRNPLMEVP